MLDTIACMPAGQILESAVAAKGGTVREALVNAEPARF